jgi:hypothetical protein
MLVDVKEVRKWNEKKKKKKCIIKYGLTRRQKRDS